MGVLYRRHAAVSTRFKHHGGKHEYVCFERPLIFCYTCLSFLDYAVVIMGAVFVFSSAWWMLSAKQWFYGPVKNIDSPVERSGLTNGENSGTVKEERSSIE